MTRLTATRPLVSVITPFYNTAQYLAECIESVLAQTYPDFEYILMDNCSTDGSGEIAEAYARCDPRIRLIRCSEFLPQIPNYNRALAQISQASLYCKVVEADNYIFPECLALMVRAFEASDLIGLVCSYCIRGNIIDASGYPYPTPHFPGRECVRWYLTSGIYVFGTPTAVMYRSCVVRQRKMFYNETLTYFADFDKCIEILLDWDFGFVHQVLSFTRGDNDSISSSHESVLLYAAASSSVVQRYAAAVLDAKAANSSRKQSRREYYSLLARQAMTPSRPGFWKYHMGVLRGIEEKIDLPYLSVCIIREGLWRAVNPGITIAKALRLVRRLWQTKRITVEKVGIALNAEIHREPIHRD
jgi:glycosyltransferase involved in cell wall biosynthesis